MIGIEACREVYANRTIATVELIRSEFNAADFKTNISANTALKKVFVMLPYDLSHMPFVTFTHPMLRI